MADIVIIGAVALGTIAGWRKGFVLPLIALGGALLSIASLYASPLNGIVPTGAAGLGLGAVALFIGGAVLGRVGGVLVGLVHRVPALRRLDQVVGIPLGAATAAFTAGAAPFGAQATTTIVSTVTTGGSTVVTTITTTTPDSSSSSTGSTSTDTTSTGTTTTESGGGGNAGNAPAAKPAKAEPNFTG